MIAKIRTQFEKFLLGVLVGAFRLFLSRERVKKTLGEKKVSELTELLDAVSRMMEQR